VYPAGEYSWIIGAFLLFPLEVFRRIGMFDEGTFLYGEENIIGAKLHSIGRGFFFEPAAKIRHIGQASSAHLTNTGQKSDICFQSCLRYYSACEKHYNFTLWLLLISYKVYRHFWGHLFTV